MNNPYLIFHTNSSKQTHTTISLILYIDTAL